MIVVTGATGHIGNVLVRDLLAQGKVVRVLTLPHEDTRSISGLNVERVSGDVRDRNSLTAAFAGASLIYYLAGLISIRPGQTRSLMAVNVIGTRNVIEASKACGVNRLVYVSSVHALVESLHGTPITEAAGCDPEKLVGAYAKSKAMATQEVLCAARNGLNAVIVFSSGVIGPFDFNVSDMGQVVLDFLRRKLPAYIDGAYDFTDVRDVAAGIIRAGEKGRSGEGYILSGEKLPISRLMTLLEELSGVQAPSLRLPRRVAATAAIFAPLYYLLAGTKPRLTRYAVHVLGSNCLFSCDKARKELGYTCRPIRDTLADSIEWFRASGML